MILRIFAIRDTAADAFMQPFFANTNAQAVRNFADVVNRKREDNAIANHPADFDLYLLGHFDDNKGVIEKTGPDRIVTGLSLVKTTE